MQQYNPKRFAEWLTSSLEESNFKSLSELAEAIKKSRATLSRYARAADQTLTGKPSRPKPEVVDALAKALNRPIEEARHAAGYTSPNEKPSNSLREFTEARFPGADKLTDADYELISNVLETFVKTKLKNK